MHTHTATGLPHCHTAHCTWIVPGLPCTLTLRQDCHTVRCTAHGLYQECHAHSQSHTAAGLPHQHISKIHCTCTLTHTVLHDCHTGTLYCTCTLAHSHSSHNRIAMHTCTQTNQIYIPIAAKLPHSHNSKPHSHIHTRTHNWQGCVDLNPGRLDVSN